MTAKKKGSAIQSDQALQKVEYVHFNKKTREAIIRAHAEEEGLIPNTGKTFDNVDDAMKALFGKQ